MDVAELFVTLGIKGADKTISAVTQVKAGLGQVASTSLEAKAALVGAMYALERLMSASGARGTELSNFNALTGISVKQLQQWQYAARQAGESNEEFTGSLKAVQDKIAQLKLGKSQPEGLAVVQSTVGFDVQRAYKDTFYVMEQLQKFAHSNVATDVQNQILKGFGLSENTIAAMRKGVFNETNFKRAPLYGDSEINQLNKVNVQWSNLENKIGMLFGHFTAAHGGQLVGDISKIADQVFKMIEAFQKLSDQLKIFKHIEEAFAGWAKILQTVTDLIDRISAKTTKDKEKAENKLEKGPIISSFLSNFTSSDKLQNLQAKKENEKLAVEREKVTSFFPSLFSGIKSSVSDFFSGFNNNQPENNTSGFTDYSQSLFKLFDKKDNNLIYPIGNQDNSSFITPKVIPSNNSTTNTQNTNINQNLYFQHEGKDYPKIKDSVQKSVNDAWKQLSAQSQGT